MKKTTKKTIKKTSKKAPIAKWVTEEKELKNAIIKALGTEDYIVFSFNPKKGEHLIMSCSASGSQFMHALDCLKRETFNGIAENMMKRYGK